MTGSVSFPRLAEFFEPEDARRWFFAPHPQLNGERPADLVAKGRQKEVLAFWQ